MKAMKGFAEFETALKAAMAQMNCHELPSEEEIRERWDEVTAVKTFFQEVASGGNPPAVDFDDYHEECENTLSWCMTDWQTCEHYGACVQEHLYSLAAGWQLALHGFMPITWDRPFEMLGAGMKPQRTQRKRGQKSPLPHSKDVGRNTRWGNPFFIGDDYGTRTIPEAIEKHKKHLLAGTLPRIRGLKPATVADVKKHLAGWNLACGCDLGEPCHGDILLEVANGDQKNKTPAGGLTFI